MSRTGDDVQTDRTAAGGDGIAELIGDTDGNERRECGAAGNAGGLLGEEKLRAVPGVTANVLLTAELIEPSDAWTV